MPAASADGNEVRVKRFKIPAGKASKPTLLQGICPADVMRQDLRCAVLPLLLHL